MSETLEKLREKISKEDISSSQNIIIVKIIFQFPLHFKNIWALKVRVAFGRLRQENSCEFEANLGYKTNNLFPGAEC